MKCSAASISAAGSIRPVRLGMTLIELLAVIIIMSLVATVLTVNLGGASDQAQFMRTLAQVQSLDARGRLHARTSAGMVVLHIDEDRRQLRLASATSGERLAEFDVPAGIAIAFRTDRPMISVAFGRNGRSLDYEIHVVADHRQATLRVCGLSGFIQEEAVP